MLEGRLMKTKSRGFLVILLVVFVIIAGSGFPFYNWNKHYSYTLTGITLWLNIACYIELGVFERRLLPDSATVKIVLINFGIVLAGMGCRYLLEFGEVSNTFNFTLLNIASHMMATLIISMFSYILSKPANQVANE